MVVTKMKHLLFSAFFVWMCDSSMFFQFIRGMLESDTFSHVNIKTFKHGNLVCTLTVCNW